jgi:hypothetical protein
MCNRSDVTQDMFVSAIVTIQQGDTMPLTDPLGQR